mmetsp:Transcript_4531/g.12816  ORF Transcript_4531/g.12816 Transcript_4531/m.12816 type:complete len:380 (-) Transcript_4531:131-1270(-)
MDADDQAGAAVQRDRQVHPQQSDLHAARAGVLHVLRRGEARPGSEAIHHQPTAVHDPVFEKNTPHSTILQQLLAEACTEIGHESGVRDGLLGERKSNRHVLFRRAPLAAQLHPVRLDLVAAQRCVGTGQRLPGGGRHNCGAFADRRHLHALAADEILQCYVCLRAHHLHAAVARILSQRCPERCVDALAQECVCHRTIAKNPNTALALLPRWTMMMDQRSRPIRIGEFLRTLRSPRAERDELLRPLEVGKSAGNLDLFGQETVVEHINVANEKEQRHHPANGLQECDSDLPRCDRESVSAEEATYDDDRGPDCQQCKANVLSAHLDQAQAPQHERKVAEEKEEKTAATCRVPKRVAFWYDTGLGRACAACRIIVAAVAA